MSFAGGLAHDHLFPSSIHSSVSKIHLATYVTLAMQATLGPMSNSEALACWARNSWNAAYLPKQAIFLRRSASFFAARVPDFINSL